MFLEIVTLLTNSKKNPIVTPPKYWFHCKHFDRVRTKVPKQQPEDLLHIFWWCMDEHDK